DALLRRARVVARAFEGNDGEQPLLELVEVGVLRLADRRPPRRVDAHALLPSNVNAASAGRWLSAHAMASSKSACIFVGTLGCDRPRKKVPMARESALVTTRLAAKKRSGRMPAA